MSQLLSYTVDILFLFCYVMFYSVPLNFSTQLWKSFKGSATWYSIHVSSTYIYSTHSNSTNVSDPLLLWYQESARSERRQAFANAKHLLTSYILYYRFLGENVIWRLEHLPHWTWVNWIPRSRIKSESHCFSKNMVPWRNVPGRNVLGRNVPGWNVPATRRSLGQNVLRIKYPFGTDSPSQIFLTKRAILVCPRNRDVMSFLTKHCTL
jgi:hypothetical protein